MGTVYEELDEAKAEIEKLKGDYRTKLELFESLNRAHNAQQRKFQEASLKLEKLSEELNEKGEEISVAKQMYEELKSNLKEKEGAIKQLACANDKLRADCKEKVKSFEEENRGLALALDEANEKNMDHEQHIRSLKEEIEGLRGLVSASRIKCPEGDQRSKVKQREDVLLKLEEDKIKYEDQLKWKKEQFGHLEEAHQKLRHQFQASENEWEREKGTLLDEISRLQTDLDSQIRISKSLQSQLQMCNQALAHEESKRKYLEVQLSESKAHFDNVFFEYEEAKSTIERLTCQRDAEIGSLRNSLCIKESLCKEMEYHVRILKQENQELLESLKEFQEGQISEGGGRYSSLTKLRNKLRGLEQVHRACSAKLESNEAECNTQLEILREKLNCCISELESRNALIDHLRMEVEAHDSLIVQQALHNEESALMILVLKSAFLEAKTKLADAYAELDYKKKESEENLSLFRGLQKVHRDSSAQLKFKEAEWNSQLEILTEKLEHCSSEIEGKSIMIDQLIIKAEANHSIVEQLVLHDEEATVMVLVLKAALAEAQMKFTDACADFDFKNQQNEESLSLYSSLQQVHQGCYARHKSKEDEWNSQLKILTENLKCCSSELESKNTMIDQLKMEAEAHDSLIEQLTLHNEEAGLIVMVSKSEFSEAQTKLAQAYVHLDESKREINGSLSQLQTELEMKNSALMKAQKDAEKKCKKVSDLSVKVESLSYIEEQKLLQQKELQRLENMLSESHTIQSELKKQLLRLKNELKEDHSALNSANEELQVQICQRMESELSLQIWSSFTEQLKSNLEESHQIHRNVEASLYSELRSLKSNLKKACKTLDGANEELAVKICDENKADFELQVWKSIAEQLKANLEENHQMRKEVEASLLAEVGLEVNLKHEKERLLNQLEEKDKKIDNLNEQINHLNGELERRGGSYSTPASTTNAKFHDSQQRTTLETVYAEEEWVKRELEGAILAQVDAEENYEHEKESLHQLVEERDQRIAHLQQLVKSLEQEFESSAGSFSSRLSGMQLEINSFQESWQKIATLVVLKEMEIEEKNSIILELENNSVDLKACSEASKSEMQRLRAQLVEEQSRSDALVEKLRDEKDKMAEDATKLSSERENVLDILGGLSDRVNELLMEDVQLMESLRSMMQACDSDEFGKVEFKWEDKCFDSVKENRNLCSSPGTKRSEAAVIDERLPLRALNS